MSRLNKYNKKVFVVGAIVSMISAGPSWASSMDFKEAYDAMLHHSARYQAQLQRQNASRHGIGKARAGFLPTVSLSGSYGLIQENNDIRQRSIAESQESASNTASGSETLGLTGLSLEGAPVPFRGEYENGEASIDLTQTIIDRKKWVGYGRAKSKAKEAKLDLIEIKETLTLELARAYFGWLSARDVLEITSKELESLSKHKNLTSERHQEKLGTLTDVYEADSRYQLVYADQLDASKEKDQFEYQLKLLTGEYVQNLSSLSQEVKIPEPIEVNIDELVDKAQQHDSKVRLAKQRVATANYDVKNENANFLPTLSLSAQSRITTSEFSSVSNDEDLRRNQVMLLLEVPLFAGFGNYARAKEAKYNLKAQQLEYRNEFEETEQRVRDSHTEMLVNYERMKIIEQAYISAQNALSLREQGYLDGLSSNLDLLDATRDSYRTERAWRRAQYAYIVSSLQAVANIREITEQDVIAVNQLLDTAPVNK